jgi:hypothetical protein
VNDPIFFRRSDCLEPNEALYWKDLLYRVIKVGTELEVALPKGMRKGEYLPGLISKLEPSGDIGRLGRYGVLDVTTEHCGVEVRVIGRQPHFGALQRQMQCILAALPAGTRARPTCGLHFHVLAVGLYEPVPEIILGNVWNLTRRYAAELRFLTSCGDSRAALCRRRNHCSHVELVRWTSGTESMAEIQRHLRESLRVDQHQSFLNLEHLLFDETGAVTTLHYENRFPDADLSATSIVAKTFLFLAILLKAVELSQHGIIHVGRIAEWRRKVQLLDALSNNRGTLATSDTSAVDDAAIDELRHGCRELLGLLKPVIARCTRASVNGSASDPAFAVLSLLAETPVSLLRADGLGWDEIEHLLDRRARTAAGPIDADDHRLIRLIEVAQVSEVPEPERWRTAAARSLFLSPDELERRLDRLDQWRGLRWDAELGSMVFVG